MKSFALFLLLTGVLTADANTLVDDNISGEIKDAELTDEDLDSLKSTMKERALAGELNDDDVDFMKLVMEERGLTMEEDDDNDDLERAAMDERALTEDLDDADTDLEKSTIEERGLTGDATGVQPVDVARRGRLRCRRWWVVTVCFGLTPDNTGIVLTIRIGLWYYRKTEITVIHGKTYSFNIRKFLIQIRDVNWPAKKFRLRIKYKVGRFWKKTHYIRKTFRINL